MFDKIYFRKNLIILLFSISIFFSFVNFYYIELRFSYLFLIILIFFEKNLFKKLQQNKTKVLIFYCIILFIHHYLNNILNFNKSLIYDFFSSIVLFQILIIGISIFVINYFKEIVLSNLKKLFDFFIYIFFILIFFYNLANKGIIFDTLYKCDLGFFYYTKFIFLENSHFGVIASTVILNFVYNIKYYLTNKILFILNLIFVFFAFGNFSLSFYLASLFSIILIFVSYKNLDKFRIILLVIFMILSNFFMFNGNHVYKFLSKDKKNFCVSQSIKIENEYNLKKNSDLYKGIVLEPKNKLQHFFRDDKINLSTAVYIYSVYVAKKALLNNPLGYGIHNYKKFREKVEIDIKVKEGNYAGGTIVFEETYMPSLPATLLNFNLNSGSNNFSKIIVEFGIFGIFFILLFLIALFSKKINDEIKFLLLPLIFSQLFIRGSGYFNFGFLVVSIIIMILMFQNILRRNEK